MFRMAATFREMVKTKKEPIPHEEIVAVTAIVHAGAKSLKEKSSEGHITLVFAARDHEHNSALVLKRVLDSTK